MSYRSALNNPVTGLGNVGQVIEVTIPSSPATPIVSGGASPTIAAITLSPGTWLLNLAYFIQITGVSSNGDLGVEMPVGGGSTLAFVKTLFPEKSTSTTSVGLQVFDSFILTATTTTSYTLNVSPLTYTGGTMAFSNAGFNPSNLVPTISATKLA